MLKLSLLGAGLVAVTVTIHALGTTILVRYLVSEFMNWAGNRVSRRMLAALTIAALVLVFLHAVEIMVWAGVYKALLPAGQLNDFEAAVYFSFVTFTTLGYGDITLSEGYRLLSGIQALNGILLVGWSTALMFAVVQKTWQVDEAEAEASETASKR
jgi:uncharacterized protein YhhL (DUF1145 family)